ncbi:Conjugal transfer protein TraG [Methyloligella halotolerans]|uniref:Conjugal transfer protein TraG n=1 Tax=Methyloligella halotolerans TaxID=1177755 RepID=A0A1E2RWS9_9HYPH|nr:type IV secretory system conjugative DNA transfer family protein [Methyloligella halotolerans]ODA66580.1 Conjugal transfer protein TraG [Methyloligella halotolerans]
MSSSAFNEEYRFGSAAWAGEYGLGAAGLFKHKGPQIGYFGSKPLHLDSDAPMLTIGGAGSGKLRDIIGYVVCNSPGQRMIALDPRGELSAISFHVHAQNDEYAYFWNPFGLHGLPQHACNPLDILEATSPNFHADCKFVARALVPVSGAAEGKYFEQRASAWIEALIKADVEGNGQTSLPRLGAIVNLIESGNALWADVLEAMLGSAFDDVRRTAGEMLVKQQDAPREFGSVMGEIYANLGFLDDPVLQRHLREAKFSLSALCNPARVTKIFLIVPAEYLKQLAPILRLMFTGTMLYKARAPEAARVMMLVDEAGQLGSFDALLQAFTYGRGAGIRSWAFFQDAGQMVRHYGQPGLQGFMGSAQMRQFFGVRDYQTAQLVSNMLGGETLEYDDPQRQEAAKHLKLQALQKLMNGEDAFGAMIDAAHHSRAAQIRTKQARKLMTEEEILSLPEDRQIIFISGKNLPPVLANKYPYFSRREMAGLYLPNPYHPPGDRVPVKARFGRRWLRVIREGVPEEYAAFPQYSDGEWAYLEGYKPR